MSRESSNTCQYKRAIVTFIDILGFKKLVETESEKTITDLLELFHMTFNECTMIRVKSQNTEDGTIKTETSTVPQILHFSDSIVRISYPDYFGDVRAEVLDDMYEFNKMTMEISCLSHIQETLLCKGILIRGGMTIGDIVFDSKKDILFGPALNRAYYLENTISHLPRIIIDPSIVNKASFYFGGLVNSGLLCLDDEMTTYIEYFGIQTTNKYVYYLRKQRKFIEKLDLSYFDDSLESEFSKLKQKKEVLQQGLDMYVESDNIQRKYIWAILKHNESVETFFSLYLDIKPYITYLPTEKASYKVDTRDNYIFSYHRGK